VPPPATRAAEPLGSREGILWLLREAARVEATEIHIKAPGPVTVRVEGGLQPFGPKTLTPADSRDAALSLAELAGREGGLAAGTELEFSFGLAGVGRFHACLYHQRGSLAAVVRRVALSPPALAALGAPDALIDVLVPGRIVALVGSDRLDWLHALVNHWNQTREGYVVMVERPLRYLHRDANSGIAQREIGQDVRDAASGIRLAARLEADLITCSDLSELESVEAALSAAEQGLRVLVALEAPKADGLAEWVVQRFGGASRDDIRRRLAAVLYPVPATRG
jgi:twitching motility protein PilT